MQRSLLDILHPSSQEGGFELVEFCADASNINYGLLLNPETGYTRLILAGFPLFTETVPAFRQVDDLQALKSIEQELFGDPYEYQAFVAEKWRRPNRDAYAAFQPFNESTRALYSLVPLLRERLRPGDYILDTWCRTGWTGELLAALFPQQRIVSIWEGNHGALGYQAFRHWLPHGKRAANLDIVFHHINQPLPFKSGSFAAVIGLDTLHRYDADKLVPECLRVCRHNAPILFPHVHLTNSEPNPWFDRGCRQEHGLYWNEYLEKAAAKSGRSVYIESEMALFRASSDSVVANNPLCSHYNALAGLVPREWMGAALSSIENHFLVDEASYIIVNPLLSIDLNRLRVDLRRNEQGGMTEYILTRHPDYEAFLASRLRPELSAEQSRVLYWAQKAVPLGYIAERLGESLLEIQQLLMPLLAADIVLVLPVSRGMAELNHYFAHQAVVTPLAEQNLAALWKLAVRNHAERVYVSSIEDDLELTYAQFDSLVADVALRLLAELPQAGMPVCVAAQPNLETVLLFWAAQCIGRPFVSIDPAWSPSRIADLMQQQEFKLLFTNIEIPRDCEFPATTTVIAFESAAGTAIQHTRFDDWLDTEATVELPEHMPNPASAAVILFTSGTTGQPKGIELAHRAVWQSTLSVAHHYAWKADDVFLSIGNYATISGLRNSLVATASAGCKLLIPDSVGRSSMLEAISMMGKHAATIMGVVPAFVTRLAALAKRLDPAMFSSLRLLVSTGSNLQPAAAGLVEDQLGVPVYNYYGLTETCGACIFMPRSTRGDGGNCIGLPVDAIAQIVTEDGRVIDGREAGELRIYSGNLLSNYLDDHCNVQAVMRHGWVYSGDIGRWSEDGLIELRGRKKDMIKVSSGELIYLSEVEQCLLRHTDSGEVAVAGFVDDYGDDRMACFVTTFAAHSTAALLIQFNEVLRTSLGRNHQLSRVIYVDSFPRGANEKIQRNELVRLHSHHLGGKSVNDS